MTTFGLRSALLDAWLSGSNFVVSLGDCRGGTFSLDNVRSLKILSFDWFASTRETLFLAVLGPPGGIESVCVFNRGIRLWGLLPVLEQFDIDWLSLRKEAGGEGAGCDTQSSDRESSHRSIVFVYESGGIAVGGLHNGMMQYEIVSDRNCGIDE